MSERYSDGGGNIPMKRNEESVTAFTMRRIRAEIIEECAKVADEARESAAKHHGVEASIGADIAARRIRALVGQPAPRDAASQGGDK